MFHADRKNVTKEKPLSAILRMLLRRGKEVKVKQKDCRRGKRNKVEETKTRRLLMYL